MSETTAALADGAAATKLPDGEVALPLAEARGQLQIARRVVEKIAAQAVSEVEHATGVSRQVLGMGRGPSRTSAQISASIDGDIATVEIIMSVLWPAPVPEVTRRVREQVTNRLAELASLRAAEVDIEVTALPTSYGPPSRRVS